MRRPRLRAAIITFIVVLAAVVGLPGTAHAAPTAACTISNNWGSGFQVNCTIGNSGPSPVSGWTLEVCFPSR
jgi:hypothetical protein